MAASSGFMIAEAERRFPVRVRIGVPPDGLGPRLDRIKTWLDENAGANGWAMTLGHTRCPERRLIDLFRRSDPCECIRRPVVCRLPSRDLWGRLPSAGGRADATSRGLAASDTLRGKAGTCDALRLFRGDR